MFRTCKTCLKENKAKNKFCIFCGTKFSTSLSLAECYALLEISSQSTNIEVKQAYRRLAKLYHSDILKGKGLPSDMIAFGEEKFKKINFAYENIKNARNI